jgi:beta-galactosidase
LSGFFALTNSGYTSGWRPSSLRAVRILNRRRTSIAAVAKAWLNCATIIFGLMLANLCLAAERPRIGLDGEWGFRLDPQNVGVSERWFEEAGPLSSTIKFPGAWQAQGYGERAGILRHHYAGAAWYWRKITVPSSWSGKLVNLRIGGAHRLTQVFVNGVDFGEHNGFNAPFSFDVTRAIRAGAENIIALRVVNPPFDIETSPDKQIPTLPVGMFDYIANWGGIYGDVTLEAEDRAHIESVLVSSDTDRRIVTFQLKLATEAASGLWVRVSIPNVLPINREVVVESTGEAEASIEVPLPNASLWSPDHPNLLTASIQLLRGENEIDQVDQRFGFRQVTTRGNVLLLNGKPLYLRAYGDDDVEVLNGFPPASPQKCLERMRLAKSFGFNAVRFHSMTPPECYFNAADEAGILIMAELPAAYTQYFFAHRDFLRGELQSTLIAYRNHPSLLSLAFGNEFNLRWLKTDADRQEMTAWIAEFYRLAKQLAPSTLIMSNDGFDLRPTDMVSLSGTPPPDRPTVRHEFGGYYCSLPNPGLIDQFTGVMIPEWLERKKQWISSNHLEDIYPKYLQNSIRLQQLGRKFQIENVRADRSVTGYDSWLLVDYPGGTGEGDSWEEGWFDYFWHPKVSSDQGRELNSAVLTIISAGENQRTLWVGGSKHISLRISNYGEDAIENGSVSWALMSKGTRLDGGEIRGVQVPLGEVADVGQIILHAPESDHPRKIELVATVMAGPARYSNRWDFWAFPRKYLLAVSPVPIELQAEWSELRHVYPWLRASSDKMNPKSLLITESLSEGAISHLHQGGRVLLIMKQQPSDHGIPFFPASGGAMGTLIPDSAALGDFPNQGFADLQFYNLLNGTSPIPLDAWPAELKPIVGAIRTTSEFLSQQKGLSRVGYVFQARVGEGELLVTSPGLWNHYDDLHPEAIYLFDRLLRYASSDNFAPGVEVSNALLQNLQAK